MIKIEFPANRKDIAKAISTALLAISEDDYAGTAAVIEAGDAEPGHDEAKYQKHLEEQRESFDAFQADILVRISQTFGLDIKLLEDAVGATPDDEGRTLFTENELKEGQQLTDDAKRDPNGVAFNEEFCGNAAKPFYASGKREGQWKKRQGLDDAAYDAWYAAELAKVKVPPSEDTDETIDTSGAFGGGGDQQQQQNPVPHDAGTLMAWVSEMQTAGRITQEQVNAAYTQANLTMMDIFESPEKTPDIVAERVGILHSILSAWA